MADLLTHVLAVYVVLTVASWWVESLRPRWIAIGMAGGAIPDLVKVDIVLDDDVVSTALDLPFEWAPISTLGGVLLVAGAITLGFSREQWRRVYVFLVGGGCISLVLDGLRVYADGQSGPWLYPFSWWYPPTPSLYVTSDPTVLVVGVAIAAIVFALDWKLQMDESHDPTISE